MSKISEGSLVRVLDDAEKVKSLQGDNPGWNIHMNHCLGNLGYVKRTFSIDGVSGCRLHFENVSWSFNNEALTLLDENDIERFQAQFSHVRNFIKGDIVKLTTNIEAFIKNQESHGGWVDEMQHIVGKLAYVKENCQSENLRIRYGKNRIYVVNKESVNLIYTYRKLKNFNTFDVVKVKSSLQHVRNIQAGHGEWISEMADILGQQVTIVKVLHTGDIKISFNNKIWTMNPMALLHLDEEDDKYHVGDHVQVLDDKEKVKLLQKDHGGYSSGMDVILGKVGEVSKVLPTGDLKVQVLNRGLRLNPEAVTLTDSKLSTMKEGADGVGEGLFKNILQSMHPQLQDLWKKAGLDRFAEDVLKSETTTENIPEGSLVRVLNDEEELKRIQGASPGWVSSMSACLGKIGYIKRSIELMNVAKVTFGDCSWSFKMEALQRITSDELQQLQTKYGSVDDFEKGDFVQVVDDLETVKQKQENHGGWNDKMGKIVGKIGFVKMTFPDGDPLVRFGSLTKYRINKQCLKLIYTLRRFQSQFKLKEKMRVINSLHHLTLLQNGRDNQSDLEIIVGKEVSISEKLPNGDISVIFNENTWTLNPLTLQDLESDDKLFSPGDSVKIIPDKRKVKQLQRGHGEYPGLMDVFLGKVGRFLGYDGDGDLRVQFPGQKLTLNPLAVVPTNEPISTLADMCGLGPLSEIKKDKEKKQKEREQFKTLPEKDKNLVLAIETGKLVEVQEYFQDNNINTKFISKTALHFASSKNQIEVVKFLIEKKADPNIVDYKSRTPLLIASKKGNFEIVEILLEADSSAINIRDHDENSPLVMASWKGHLNIVNKLLEYEADTELCDSDGDSPLHLALAKQNVNLAKLLIRTNPNLCNIQNNKKLTPLHIATSKGLKDVVSYLIEHGANVEIVDSDDDTALHLAAQKNHFDIIKQLIDKNSSIINMKNEQGRTSLHNAAFKGHAEIVQYLLEHGADPNAVDSQEDTPLHDALSKEQIDTAKLLIQANCDLKGNKKQRTALHISAYKGYKDLVQSILEKGVDLSVKDNKGNTALHTALKKNQTEIAELLIERGAPLDIENADGCIPLHFAALTGSLRATTLILQTNDEIVDEKKNDGYTPLHLAANNDHSEILQVLLLKGKADPNSVNNKKQTALHLAVKEGYENCVKILVQNGADVNKQDTQGNTSLHLALNVKKDEEPSMFLMFRAMFTSTPSDSGKIKKTIAKYLMSHGADIEIRNNKGKRPLDYIDDEDIKKELLNASQQTPSLSVSPKRKIPEKFKRPSINHDAPVAVLSAECMICMASPRNIVFSCGHSVCKNCSDVLIKCPYCMMDIELRIPLLI